MQDSKPETSGDAPAEPNGDSAEAEGENGKSAGEEAAAEGAENGEKKTEGKKRKEPRYEWVDVKKTKKRTKRTDLKITTSNVPGIPEEQLQKLMDSESAMQTEMRDIIETDERRNDLEAYIFKMRAQIAEGAELGDFISASDRDAFNDELMKAEDWLMDTFDATKTMYVDKLDELKRTGEPAAWRCREFETRPDWIKAVHSSVANYRSTAEEPGEKFGHIAAENLAKIIAACQELSDWLTESSSKQEKMAKHEMPVLLCAEMEKRNQEMARMADEILKEPKPAPPKEEKAEEPTSQEADKPAEEAAPNSPDAAAEPTTAESPKDDEPEVKPSEADGKEAQ